MSVQPILNGFRHEEPDRDEEPINVTDRKWVTRSDRDELRVRHHSNKSLVRFLKQFCFPDISFALGSYKFGQLQGPPKSFFKENKKSKLVQEYLSTLEDKKDKYEQSKAILKKLAGHPSMVTIRILGWMLGKLWSMVFTSIEVEGLEKIVALVKEARDSNKAIVFLPTHRSHIDYLLMSYVCFGANLPMPSIVARDNMNMFLIGNFLASGGAFFIRSKNSDDVLYKRLLKKYVQDILLSGKVLELFVEGGRTRTGFISKPKLGLLNNVASILTDPVCKDKIKDVLLVPVAIDYENVVENIDARGQGGYAAILLGAKKSPESFTGTIRLMFRLLLGGNSSHGKAFVKFGKTLSLKAELTSRENKDSLKEIGAKIVKAQQEVSKVTSISILSFVLLNLTTADLEDGQSKAKDFKRTLSIQELLNLCICFRTNHFKAVMVNTIVLPRFILVLKLLFAYNQVNVTKFYFVGSLLNLVENDYNLEQAERMIWEGLSILESFFQKRSESEKSYFSWFDSLKATVIGKGGEEQRITRTSIESDAKFRLNLSYSYGQLSVILLPFSLAAVSFVTKTSSQTSLDDLTLAVSSYYAGEVVSAQQLFEAKKVLLRLVTKQSRSEFDTCCSMFVGHILPIVQVNQFETHTKAPKTVDAVQELCRERIKEDRNEPGIHIRPEILNKSLIKSQLQPENVVKSKSFYELIEKISVFMVVKQRRVLSSKKVSYVFRDLNYLTNKRLRKVVGFMLVIWLLKWALKN